MVYLPQDIFKRILSFKDPRYERVMHVDPYMATPTRVFYTRDEFRKDRNRNIPAVSRPERRDQSDDPIIFVHHLHEYKDFGLEDNFQPMTFVHNLEYRRNGPVDLFDSDDDSGDHSDDVIRCSHKVAKMTLQCEARGPDSELYQRRR